MPAKEEEGEIERGREIAISGKKKGAIEPGCKVIQRQTRKTEGQCSRGRKSKIEYSIQRRGDKNARGTSEWSMHGTFTFKATYVRSI